MKTLSQALENTLTIAEQTANSRAVSRYSSTNSGGLMTLTPQQLTENSPEDNNKNLVQFLKHTLQLPLNTSKKIIYTEYGADFIDDVQFGELTDEQREQAKAAIEQYDKPLPSLEMIKLIARLQMIAPERTKSEVDTKARTAIWIEELSNYPADIVLKVLKMRYRWFPALAEVLEHCDTEARFRRLLAAGIRIARREKY